MAKGLTQVFKNESIIVLKSLFFHYFKVRPGLGEHGKGVSLPKEQTEEDIKENMKLHSFNKYVSDVISLKRELPDTRHHTCRQINYDNPKSLPTTSVILIFSNEALSAVLRTVWSLILRTPKEMLNEIILVDDGSTHEGQFNFVFHIQTFMVQ